MSDNKHAGHRKKLRERFLKEGLDSFETHNVLEFMLFYAIPRKDTNEIAHDLIKHFGSFSGVIDAPLNELLKIEGIGENAAVFIKSIGAFCRRYYDDKIKDRKFLDTVPKLVDFLRPKFLGRTTELVYLLCLDQSCKLLNCSILFEGAFNRANIQPRAVVEYALKYNAPGVVIAHNHPMSVALPSNEDTATTYSLIKALRPLEITLVDHIIVDQYNDFLSYSDSGYLNFPQM